MNIGFDAKRLFCNFTGLGNYSRTLVKNLSIFYPENNYTLYTPKIKETPETFYFTENKNIKTFIPKNVIKPYWRSFSVVNQLINDKIDIYHGLSHEIPFSINKSKIKSVVTIHDLIFEVYPETYSFIDRKIYKLKFKYACENADKIIAISESTKKDIIKYFHIDPQKIDVVYQACNPLFLKKQTIDEVNTVIGTYNLPADFLLYVGSIIERKNLLTIIETYKFLDENLQLPLVIIGKGKKYMELVKKQVHRYKLDKKIIWIENLTNNTHLQAIYQKASIFIYPSLYEGFGIPIIEALLSGTPVITSNRSSLPEAGGPSTYYIDPLDARQMAAGIEKILTDESYRNQMVINGYQYAIEKFNDQIVTDKLIQVYKSVII